ncbi:MAG: hypothetical protein M3448_02930 [Pseudomonadota bacterium]|nr:hypothetical protein [Pseudomonadota bacterium]
MNQPKQTRAVITVTPLPPASGNEIECDISGTDVIDDAIYLDRSRDYLLAFQLDEHGSYQWDRGDPFNARNGKCPKPNKPGNGRYKVASCTDHLLEVTARGPSLPKKEVVHYRLNFAGGITYDPIIIRD